MIIVHNTKKGPRRFYFTVCSRNGQVLATSETYTRKSNCKKAIDALRNSAFRAIKDETVRKPRKDKKK